MVVGPRTPSDPNAPATPPIATSRNAQILWQTGMPRFVATPRELGMDVEHAAHAASPSASVLRAQGADSTTSGRREISACMVDETSTIEELRACIRDNALDIKTAGEGRTKEAILADIRRLMMSVSEDSSIGDLRAFIKLHKLDITTAGQGRTKCAIFADILAACPSPPLPVNEASSMAEIREFIDNTNALTHIKTAGTGRTKAAVLAEIRLEMSRGLAVLTPAPTSVSAAA